MKAILFITGLGGLIVTAHETLRVQVANNHLLAPNLHYKSYYPIAPLKQIEYGVYEDQNSNIPQATFYLLKGDCKPQTPKPKCLMIGYLDKKEPFEQGKKSEALGLRGTERIMDILEAEIRRQGV